jgi:hypothetical protein
VYLADGSLKDGGLKDGGLKDGGLKDGGLKDGGLKDGGLKDGGLKDRCRKIILQRRLPFKPRLRLPSSYIPGSHRDSLSATSDTHESP